MLHLVHGRTLLQRRRLGCDVEWRTCTYARVLRSGKQAEVPYPVRFGSRSCMYAPPAAQITQTCPRRFCPVPASARTCSRTCKCKNTMLRLLLLLHDTYLPTHAANGNGSSCVQQSTWPGRQARYLLPRTCCLILHPTGDTCLHATHLRSGRA